MDITDAYERYKNAVSDMNAAVDAVRISVGGIPVESMDSFVENFLGRQELLILASENLRKSLNSMTYKVRELERDVRNADASLVLTKLASGELIRPDGGVSAEADPTAEKNTAASPALICSDLNEAASEETVQQNMVESEEGEENNMVESEESAAGPIIAAMNIG